MRPRLRPMGMALPKTPRTAVAPNAITSRGRTIMHSRASQWLHALISAVSGFWCRRIFPRRANLKCFTALGDVRLVARNSRLFERAIEDASRPSDKRLARSVFTVARLFADEHQGRMHRTFAEHG